MENTCDCGYKITNQHEQNMFAKWGCARAIESRSGFDVPAKDGTMSASRITIGTSSITCSHDGTPPDKDDLDDDSEPFAQQFAQKYDRPVQPEKPEDNKPTDPGNRWNSITNDNAKK